MTSVIPYDFFQDELSWWIFVLKNTASDKGKGIILDFLLESENEVGQEWKIFIANYDLAKKEWDVKELFDIVKEKKDFK